MSSTIPGDAVFDRMAGTGTTAVVSSQLNRKSISIEIDSFNVQIMKERLESIRPSEDIKKYYDYYRHISDLSRIWDKNHPE